MTESGDYLDRLNERQLRAVKHQGAALLILAGAGSGKTRVITVKIAYLIDKYGVNPLSILALTFTNKAAGEMKDRVAGIVPSGREVFIRTFHSFGAWMLRRNTGLAGLSSNFTIYDTDDSVSLLRSLYPDQNRGQLARVAFKIGLAKDYALRPSDNLESISKDQDFLHQYREYQERLDEIGNADFGDLILKPLEMLCNNPELKRRMQDRFRYILIDEYQDSNIAQYELLKELVGPGTYICAVGDDDQSIYRFRGAEVRNILTFGESFPGTDVIRLEENYRSSQSILDLASEVVKHNQSRLGKTLWTQRKGGAMPVFARLTDDNEEVAFCRRLALEGKSLNETAILYRTNAQSRLFETDFLRNGIPYRIVGTLRFYEREEIKDAVAFLKFMTNPRDEVAFRRIVNKPARGLGAASIEKILAYLPEVQGDIRLACSRARDGLKGRRTSSLSEFLSILNEATEDLDASNLSKFVNTLINRSGLADYHKSQDEVSGTGKIANLEELVNAASLYKGSMQGLQDFLESIELDSGRVEDSSDTTEAVTLITMHNTKGLEFDRVIITGLDEGLFPREEEDGDELEEERRLFYVAVTRARNELYLCSAANRRFRGRMMSFEPSRFVREIPEAFRDIHQASRLVTPAMGHGGNEEYVELQPGVLVFVDDYGVGQIVKRWYNGTNLLLMVSFESGNVATFLPKYSDLQKISVDEFS